LLAYENTQPTRRKSIGAANEKASVKDDFHIK
jgi:hypothetical protein